MTSRRHGLPPQYPHMGRRGSNTPVSQMPIQKSQLSPNRSRSLDGLLDAEPGINSRKSSISTAEALPSNDISHKTQSCEGILDNVTISQSPPCERNETESMFDECESNIKDTPEPSATVKKFTASAHASIGDDIPSTETNVLSGDENVFKDNNVSSTEDSDVSSTKDTATVNSVIRDTSDEMQLLNVQSCGLNASSDNSDIKKSSPSMLSLHSNSSDSKRKRNFMDRCVNKVRSLIKK